MLYRHPLSFPIRRPSVALLVFLLGFSIAHSAAGKKPSSPEELFNPFLGPSYAHWLVGAVVEMASEKEVDSFLLLTSDDEAAAFIEKFWAERNEGTKVFTKTPQQIFELRAGDADKRYSEGAYPGRRTARGTVLILYGEPEDVTYESPRKIDDPPLEVWKYDRGEKGLDGKKPKRQYRFVDLGDSVVLYTGQNLRPDLKKRLRRRN